MREAHEITVNLWAGGIVHAARAVSVAQRNRRMDFRTHPYRYMEFTGLDLQSPMSDWRAGRARQGDSAKSAVEKAASESFRGLVDTTVLPSYHPAEFMRSSEGETKS